MQAIALLAQPRDGVLYGKVSGHNALAVNAELGHAPSLGVSPLCRQAQKQSVDYFFGSEMRKVAPPPGVSSATMVPPWRSTIVETIERPMPEPPVSLLRELSTR
ncbi:MAG: hypothetical protein RL096_813 [Actinomycetota bacterium]